MRNTWLGFKIGTFKAVSGINFLVYKSVIQGNNYQGLSDHAELKSNPTLETAKHKDQGSVGCGLWLKTKLAMSGKGALISYNLYDDVTFPAVRHKL